jgi:hypothetical protein
LNIYNIESRLSAPDMELLPSLLRQALLERMPDAEVDPVFSLAYDDPSHFFLKKSGEIIWGCVSLEALDYQSLEVLAQEIEVLSKKFQRKLRPVLFLPPRLSEVSPLIEKLPGAPLVYEYYFLRAGTERAVALKELVIKRAGVPPVFEETADEGGYRFYKHARLNRHELEEIIDLSLQFKRLS